MTRGASPELVFSVRRESDGRQESKAGLAQWLGTRLAGGRVEGPGSIPPSHGGWFCHNHFVKSKVLGSGFGVTLGLVWEGLEGCFGMVWDRFGEGWG